MPSKNLNGKSENRNITLCTKEELPAKVKIWKSARTSKLCSHTRDSFPATKNKHSSQEARAGFEEAEEHESGSWWDVHTAFLLSPPSSLPQHFPILSTPQLIPSWVAWDPAGFLGSLQIQTCCSEPLCPHALEPQRSPQLVPKIMFFYLAMSKFSVSKLSSDLGSGLLTNKYIPL